MIEEQMLTLMVELVDEVKQIKEMLQLPREHVREVLDSVLAEFGDEDNGK